MRVVVLVLITLVFALGVAGCSVVSVDLTPRVRPLVEETVEGHGDAKIVLIELAGLISDAESSPILSLGNAPARVPLLVRLREELTKASDDAKVRALVLRINSPGGTVTASDIIYRELTLFRERARVPIVAVFMDVAASGGYYAALAADVIVAHPTTVTGSIGTIMITVNAQGLMDKLGLAAVTVKSGEHKDMGSPFRTLTADERQIFQSVINDLHGQFVKLVAERRKLPRETAARLADGRIYTAEQALQLKLIDAVGYMPDALARARSAAGLEEARVVVYKRPRQYRATYYATAEAQGSAMEAALAPLAGMGASGPRFLYLWWP
ncbi:MAG: signal peptide peptidase SppA [Candidatus Rokuibacteriota bacterium]|nr:MAG: signal peptide peptidase SppA [Candidatus Rokubacteria bacterium]